MVEFVNYVWANDDLTIRHLDLQWLLPGETQMDLPHITLSCRKFIPRNKHSHFFTWQNNGKAVEIELPPFACCDTDALKGDIVHFLDEAGPDVLQCIISGLEDKLSVLTMQEAIRYQEQSQAVTLALKIRCASYCSQGRATPIGPETLGIDDINFDDVGNSSYPTYDKGTNKLVPLSIDHQLDVALLLTIQEYQRTLLKELKRMIFMKGEKPWYEIFLATFVMLSNLEYVHGGSYKYAQMSLSTSLESTVNHLMREFIEEYEYSANNILHHFRCMLRGPEPFVVAENDPEEFRNRAKVDEHSMNYILQVIEVLKKRKFTTIVPSAINDSIKPPDGRWLTKLFQGMHIA